MSATPEELKERIEAGIPGAVAEVTGDGHHFNAVVSAAAFAGLTRIAQHRLVYDVFGAEVGDRIHALSIKTHKPRQPRGDPMSDQTANPMRDAIQEAIAENPVILFMKGNPEAPACGFSARTVAILQSLGARFAAVDILPDPRIRQELSAISNWPTIPSCSSTASCSAAATSSPRCTSPASCPRRSASRRADEEAEPVDATSTESAPLTIENRL